MRYIGIFQIMEPRNQLKADFETSITFEPLEIFDAVFTVVLRRMSSIILYMCLYLHWGLFKEIVGECKYNRMSIGNSINPKCYKIKIS